MLRKPLIEQVDDLKFQYGLMSAEICNQFDKTNTVFINPEDKLLMKIIEQDNVVNQMMIQIESHCLEIIVLQQPVAEDLRRVIKILKIVTDLERIGDHIVDLAKAKQCLGTSDRLLEVDEKIRIHMKVLDHYMRAVFEAVEKNDIHQTNQLRAKVIFDEIQISELQGYLITQVKNDCKQVNNFNAYLQILNSLTKIDDYLKSICKWVNFQKHNIL